MNRVSVVAPPDAAEDNASNKAEQAELDTDWKNGWVPFFEAFLDGSAPIRLSCLQTLIIDAVYVSSFKKMIFLCCTRSARQRTLDFLRQNPKQYYKARAYQQGLPLVIFTREELAALPPRATEFDTTRTQDDTPGDANSDDEPAEPTDDEDVTELQRRLGRLGQSQHGPTDAHGDWKGGIRYRVTDRRPLGSPALYQWSQTVSREFGEF